MRNEQYIKNSLITKGKVKLTSHIFNLICKKKNFKIYVYFIITKIKKLHGVYNLGIVQENQVKQLKLSENTYI